MTILEAAREALRMLNNVEIKGERNIVAMSRAMSLLKGVEEALVPVKEENAHDGDDQQGQDV